MVGAIPAADIESHRANMQFEYAYVAQHTDAFTLLYDGSENIGGETLEKLRIRNREGRERLWSIDPTGRIRRIVAKGNLGDVVTDLSDYRLVDGVNVPFTRHVVENERTSDLVLHEYQVNPPLDSTLFCSPYGADCSRTAAASLAGAVRPLRPAGRRWGFHDVYYLRHRQYVDERHHDRQHNVRERSNHLWRPNEL